MTSTVGKIIVILLLLTSATGRWINPLPMPCNPKVYRSLDNGKTVTEPTSSESPNDEQPDIVIVEASREPITNSFDFGTIGYRYPCISCGYVEFYDWFRFYVF